MTDRMDLDALLIGALYGELTPADEARLTAHLESHPADRSALADLTRTRAMVRESRILAVQLEPPQSVSALLLQEAARRAPKPQREAAGWFYRFTHSFMAHPAMAAAAMFVIVAGVAGVLYKRQGDTFIQSEAPAVPDLKSSISVPRATLPAQDPTGTGANRDGMGSDGYGVRLDELEAPREGNARLDTARAKDSDKQLLHSAAKEAPRIDTLDRFSEPAGQRGASDAELKPQKKTAGIELRTPEPQPRELAKNKAAGSKREREREREIDSLRGGDGNNQVASDDLGQQAPPAAGAPAAPPPPKPQAVAPAPPPAVAATTPPGPSKPIASGSAGSGRNPQNAPSRKAPRPASTTGEAGAGVASRDERRQADRPAGPADVKLAEQKDRANESVLGWAKAKHEQVIALVKSNKCSEAAIAAVAIYSRAPDFYAANVATDRSIKPCLAYVNNERQREDRVRAAKRANAVDAAPSQADQSPAKK